MKRYCPFASGSKGNCTFVETETTRLLFDAGVSARRIVQHLTELDVDPETVDAIVVSHEHTDHIRALGTLSKRYGIPIFANAETAKAICNTLRVTPRFKIFTTGESFTHADVTVHPFSIPHDAADPVAFTVTTAACKLGLCTDLGFATTLVKSKLQGCSHLILEANHQPEMVHASARPAHLKQRILGRSGHLSNAAAGELLRDVQHQGLEHVFLAHLSEECNCPQRALQVVQEAISDQRFKLTVATQHERSDCIGC